MCTKARTRRKPRNLSFMRVKRTSRWRWPRRHFGQERSRPCMSDGCPFLSCACCVLFQRRLSQRRKQRPHMGSGQVDSQSVFAEPLGRFSRPGSVGVTRSRVDFPGIWAPGRSREGTRHCPPDESSIWLGAAEGHAHQDKRPARRTQICAWQRQKELRS